MRGPVAWLAVAMMGVALPAKSDSLLLGNCTSNSINVEAYNQQDAACFIARSELYIPSCNSAAVDCVGPCKLDADSGFDCGTSAAHAGKKLYTKLGTIEDAATVLSHDQANYANYCDCSDVRMHDVMGIP